LAKAEAAEAASASATAAAAAAVAAAAAAAVAASASASAGSSATVMHTHRQDTDTQELTQQDIESARREMERAVEAMRAELGTKEAEVSRLMAASAEWADRATRAERQIADFQSKANGAAEGDEAQRKKIAQLQTQADLLRGEKDVALKRLGEAEAELRAQSGRAAVAEEGLVAQLQAQAQRLEKLTASAGEAVRLSESVRALESRATELRAERDEAKGFSAAAAARIAELEAAAEAASAGGDAAGRQAAQISALQSELAQAQARCDELKRDADESAGRFKKGKEELAMLRGEWERCDAQLRSLEAEKAGLATQLEEALEQVQALTEALTEAEGLTVALPVAAPAVDPEELASLQSRVAELTSDLADHKQRCSDAEEALAVRERELCAAVSKTSVAEARLSVAEERCAEATAQGEAHAVALRAGRAQAKAAVESLQQRLAAAAEETQALRDDLTDKDKRIAHLETTKLTQDQLEKIKAVKEERKRLSEDNKTMKKQLQALKKAYDDLKASTTAAAAASGAGAGAAQAQAQAVDMSLQLEAAQALAQALKDKLKECSQQLQVRIELGCGAVCVSFHLSVSLLFAHR